MPALVAVGIAVLLLGGCGGGDEAPAVESPDLGSADAEAARSCLREAGLEVLGGRSSPTDRDAPDVELITSVNGNQVFVAFYRDNHEAARREGEVRKNAADFGGAVRRQGSVTIVWAKPPTADSKETVEACAFV
jgi:hypothetical protein